MRPASTFFPEYGLPLLMEGEKYDESLLTQSLELFDGNPIPALWNDVQGIWHPAPLTYRKRAFGAHLAGVARAGSYPFQGFMQGSGCRYFTLDIDDHDGRGDALDSAKQLQRVSLDFGLRPMFVTSRSGTGFHAHYFLDNKVMLDTVVSAAKLIRSTAKLRSCDIMPSLRNTKGLGTLHALPFHPTDADIGGGLLLNQDFSAIDTDYYCKALEHYGAHRNSINNIRQIAAAAPKRKQREKRELSGNDELVDYLIKNHPQINSLINVDVDCFAGGRSRRDTLIANNLLRQGVSSEACIQFLMSLGDSKSESRGEEYANAIVAWSNTSGEIPEDLVGMPAKKQKGYWRHRVNPPKAYGNTPNPWWRDSVRDRLRKCRRSTAVVLAFLIDFWFHGRGVHPRTQFFLGQRSMSKYLQISATTVRRSIADIEQHFSDVIDVVSGVSHPKLRIANAYDVLL